MTDNLPALNSNNASVYQRALSFHFQTKLQQAISPGDWPAGHFIYNGATDLGNKVPCIYVAGLDQALRFEKNQVTHRSNTMISQVNEHGQATIVGDENFKLISEGVDNNKAGIRHLWGPYVLLYLLVEPYAFTTIFFGSKTARQIAPVFASLRNLQPIYLGTEFIDPASTSTSWWQATVTPFDDVAEVVDSGFTPPTEASVNEAVNKFMPKEGAEEVTEAAPER